MSTLAPPCPTSAAWDRWEATHATHRGPVTVPRLPGNLLPRPARARAVLAWRPPSLHTLVRAARNGYAAGVRAYDARTIETTGARA